MLHRKQLVKHNDVGGQGVQSCESSNGGEASGCSRNNGVGNKMSTGIRKGVKSWAIQPNTSSR